MKRYACLIAFFFFVSTVICLGQYKSFTGYGGDTLSYLQENFIKHKSLYIGKPLSALLEKLEFPIKSYISISTDGEDFHQENTGAYLQFFGRGSVGHMDDSKNVRSYSLIIYWQTPAIGDTFPYLNENWTTACRAYFKDRVIKNIKLFYNNKCAFIGGHRLCEVCDKGTVSYNALECALSYCNHESSNYDKIVCARSKCDPQSPIFDKERCWKSKCDTASVNYNLVECDKCNCDSTSASYFKEYCESLKCDPQSFNYDSVACEKSHCDTSSSNYNKEACEKSQGKSSSSH